MADAEACRDPVSWLLIERGWAVVGKAGGEVGSVEAVVGDQVAGIFNGLAVVAGTFGASRHLPAERVGAIFPGRVETDLDEDELERLEPHEAPPSVDVRPD